MHIFFPVARSKGAADAITQADATDAGQIFIVRDPEDESEWQYLGNPEIAARTSLSEVVARFIQDCAGPDGTIDAQHRVAAGLVRDALVSAAGQIDDALARVKR